MLAFGFICPTFLEVGGGGIYDWYFVILLSAGDTETLSAVIELI